MRKPSQRQKTKPVLASNDWIGVGPSGTTALGNAVDGVDAEASNTTVSDSVISANGQDGVDAALGGDLITGDWIGVDATGENALGNGTGVLVEGPNDTIGDPTGASTTIVSGNLNDGIDVSGANATGALITYAWVGVNVTGLAALPNGGNGIVLNGDGSSDYDVVSGNDGTGILVTGSSNIIYGDNIGVGKDGFTQDANGRGGVKLSQASQNFVGSGEAKNIISGNTGIGVNINGGSNNLVTNNYIGLDTNGDVLGNTGSGVAIGAGGQNNTVGGTAQGAGNVISGNLGDGVDIAGAGTSQNLVAGNFIGTDVNGATSKDNNQAATGNKFYGVSISAGASANTVGSTQSVVPNVISGNGSGNGADGVIIAGASNNVVIGNNIGTDKAGATAIPNGGDGVEINQGSTANTIGGTAAGSRNVISGNGIDGVTIGDSGTSNNVVEGDYIGTDATGTTAVANGGDGVTIQKGATANTVGGIDFGSVNVISGNLQDGVPISDADTTNNVVAVDYIGADKSGETPLAKGGNGVTIQNGASGNAIGEGAPQEPDTTVTVISGNQGHGISILQGCNNNQVLNCYIGTDKKGTNQFANQGDGVYVDGSGNTIGGVIGTDRNVISGNGPSAWDPNYGFGVDLR